jgi:hypothetical protein
METLKDKLLSGDFRSQLELPGIRPPRQLLAYKTNTIIAEIDFMLITMNFKRF